MHKGRVLCKHPTLQDEDEHEFDMMQITYKGITHLYNYSHNTDCGIAISFQGKHLKSKSIVADIKNITCEKCLDTVRAIH